MTGDMIYELLVAVNSLEPFDADNGYSSVTVEELSGELDVSLARVMRVLTKVGAVLAFGKDTSLHSSLVSKVCDIYEDPEFDEPKVVFAFASPNPILAVFIAAHFSLPFAYVSRLRSRRTRKRSGPTTQPTLSRGIEIG